MLGVIGNIVLHLAIFALVVSFVLSLGNKKLKAAKIAFNIHGIAIICTLLILYSLILTHRFEYFYVWDHTATSMSLLYLISSLWEGQEGSYLLWIFFNFLVGTIVFKKLHTKNSFGYLVFIGIQCFLLIMISGVSVGSIRIGASPFRLLAHEFPDDPVFLQDPNFVPAEGSGLNPLLQNSWMAIHPPIIFLGFAVAAIPFVLYLNGLKTNTLRETVKKVLPWSLATCMVLLTGIVMGAYWAYETLNFGGYWSWDPVENAIYMPWLLSVAALHLQLISYKSRKGLKTATMVTLFTFCMVVYSTFLTRSGILGDSSVHAFTDLGSSPLLIAFLLLAVGMSVFYPLYKGNKIESQNIFNGAWNRASFMGVAAILIILAIFQVFLTTSIPVFNSMAMLIGIDLNLTAPLEPIPFYNRAQAMLITITLLVSSLALLSSWNKGFQINRTFIFIIIGTLLLTALAYDILHPTALYTFFIASLVLVVIVNFINWLKETKTGQSYHHLTHLGFYLLLGGIVISGTSETVSTINNTLGEGQENLLLIRNKEAKSLTESAFNYHGKYRKTIHGEYIEIDKLAETSDENTFLYLESIDDSRLVNITDDHFYYKIEMKDGSKTSIHYPTILKSPKGDIIVHPEITHAPTHDYFMHLTNFSSLDPTTLSWKDDTTIVLQEREKTTYKGHTIAFNSITKENPANGIALKKEDMALRAKIVIDEKIVMAPKFIIKNDLAYMIPAYNASTGLNIKLKDIDVDKGAYSFKIGKSGMDWLTLKVVKKPFLSLIWIGSIIMICGLLLTSLKRSSQRISISLKQKRWSGSTTTQDVGVWIKKMRKNEI